MRFERDRGNIRRRGREGFTLVEVLLVLVILLIIASLAATAIIPRQRQAYINTARIQVQQFDKQLQTYYLDMNEFPSTGQGLDALIIPPSDASNPDAWAGPYIDAKAVPLDPWQRPYQYQYPGQYNPDKPDIWSLGPDGLDGTEDDITNWN